MSDSEIEHRIRERWNSLTKPPGSLGKLEDLVVRLGLIQRSEWPRSEQRRIYVFCGDHGIAGEATDPSLRVTAYPQEVTRQMVRNFLAGGAAICVLCRRFGIETVVVDCGVLGGWNEGALDRRIGPETSNILHEPAMTREEALTAVDYGRALARQASREVDLAGIGEMGIGNSTSAAALFAAYTGCPVEDAAGLGAGLDEAGLKRKVAAIRKALEVNREQLDGELGTLAAVGGFEIAVMAGFLIGAAEARLPVLVDGFIAGAAALSARAINPAALDTAIFAHRSAERSHPGMLKALGVEPLLDLGMRLGEGTGAAVAIAIVDAAIACYREMATFGEAGVASG